MKTAIRCWPEGFAGRPTLTLCINVRKEDFVPSCGRRGSLEIREQLEAALRLRGLDIDFQTIACLGQCDKGPNARLAPANSWFHGITRDDVSEIIGVLEAELAKLHTQREGEIRNGTHPGPA